jgi:hypothetical protein
MMALLLEGDESAMILRAYAPFFDISVIFGNFCEKGANFAENVTAPSGGT